LALRIFVGKPEDWPIWPTLIIPCALLLILLSAPEFWLTPEKLNLSGINKSEGNKLQKYWRKKRRAFLGWLLIISLLVMVALTVITPLFHIAQLSSWFETAKDLSTNFWENWLRWGILIWGTAWLIIWAIGRLIRWGVALVRKEWKQ
jgi:hypothetical protein